MPRSEVRPIVKMISFFEEAPLETLEDGLALAKEIVRRRVNGETVITGSGARIDPPGTRKKRKARKPDAESSSPAAE